MKSKLRNNKKGATVDNIWIAVRFFGFAILCLVAVFFWNQVTTPEMDTEFWSKSSIGANVKQDAQDFYDDIDFWIVMIYFGLHIGVLVTAFLLRSHPIVYVAGIFVIIILMLIANPLQEAWTEVYNDDTFSSITPKLDITDRIMSNFVKFEMVMGFLTLIMLVGFAKYAHDER